MEIFCIIYYILSYAQSIPQILKLIKTKSSHAYCLGMIALQFVSVLSWTIYILTSIQTKLVYVCSIIDMALIVIVDIFILKYYNNKKVQ